MKSEQFVELLNYHESTWIDFKEQQYQLDNDGRKADFIKDMASMANTIRTDPAYIIVGVRCGADGKKELLGESRHHDSADLAQLIGSKLNEPIQFDYSVVNHEGKTFGIYAIPTTQRTGPYYAREQYTDRLRPRVVYYRNASRNTEATQVVEREIYNWFSERRKMINTVAPPPAESLLRYWDEFYRSCDEFRSGALNVLVLGPLPVIPEDQLKYLGLVDWSLVIDFDPAIEGSTLFKAAKPILANRRSVHPVTKETKQTYSPARATYWFQAMGTGISPTGSWREWNRSNAGHLRSVLADLARSAQDHPVRVVIAWNASDYIRTVCEAVDASFGDAASFIYAGENPANLEPVSSVYLGTSITDSTASTRP